MKKFYVLICIIFSLFVTACNSKSTEASADEPSIKSVQVVESPLHYEEPEPESSSESELDKTAAYKESSYRNFDGKSEADFVTEDKESFDLVAMIETAGCAYYLDEATGNFIIAPVGYRPSDDFRIEVLVDDAKIAGDIISLGRLADNNWNESERHDSATDFTTKATIGANTFIIGYDELDYLYRQLRVLTAPSNTVDELNRAISAEIESYYSE